MSIAQVVPIVQVVCTNSAHCTSSTHCRSSAHCTSNAHCTRVPIVQVVLIAQVVPIAVFHLEKVFAIKNGIVRFIIKSNLMVRCWLLIFCKKVVKSSLLLFHIINISSVYRRLSGYIYSHSISTIKMFA